MCIGTHSYTCCHFEKNHRSFKLPFFKTNQSSLRELVLLVGFAYRPDQIFVCHKWKKVESTDECYKLTWRWEERDIEKKSHWSKKIRKKVCGSFFHEKNARLERSPGLPDGFFSNQKFQFGQILEGLRWENVDIFYGHLKYFADIWYILRPFGTFCVPLVHIFRFWYHVPRTIWQPWRSLAGFFTNILCWDSSVVCNFTIL
jgi:hypothetical protein